MNSFFLTLLQESLAAAAGTVAFAVLFSVERRHYVTCALIGGLGWVLDSILVHIGFSAAMARLCSSAFVALSARVLAVRQHCPGIILMIPGLFPLIPGGSVYWTVHHLVANRLSLASETGFNALKLAVALVFGIVLVFELPQDLFRPAGPSGQRKRRARKKH